MADLIDLRELEERVILIAVSTRDGDDTLASLDELSQLASTAGAVTVGRVIQSREKVHPGTYLGKGKLEEVRNLIWELDATGVICDDELSPAQLRNLEDALDTKVMDRTMVILDIFASRASTREGKIQVELAQLIQGCPAGGHRKFSFSAGRWDWNQRARRKKAGDGSSSDPSEDFTVKG